jgi:hypothetical protein
MASHSFALTNTFQPLIDFSELGIQYFNLEIQNFDGPALEFTFGDPEIAGVAIRVPNKSTTTRTNRALAGVLYGRTTTGAANIAVEVW